jgi:uncharacterized protein (DUF2062 family)
MCFVPFRRETGRFITPGENDCRSGRAMNPYEPSLANLLARISAWTRGLVWRYRRPLILTAAAAATLAVGVSAGQAPPLQPPVLIASN